MTRSLSRVVAWEFPNPIGWAIDQVAGFVGDVATAGFELVIGGLVAWVTDAVIWVVGGVFNFFLDAEDPNVQADWFMSGNGPYATTAAIGATLMVGFVLAGVTQGVLQGDVGGMLKRIALDLPISVLGIIGLVTVTQALIRLTDELSTLVMSHFQEDVADFTAVVGSLSYLGPGPSTALVVFVLGLVTVLAGLALVAELAVRAALIYIVVALAPLVFAAQLWPALKGVGQKLLRLLCGLILAKLAMAVALAVAAAAAVGIGSGGEVTALPEPEVFAEDPGGSVTQAVGILLTATAAFGVAAFMPFVVAKLLPLAEEAAVAQGVRGAPVRAAQQGMSMAYYAETIPRLASRLRRGRLISARPGPPGSSIRAASPGRRPLLSGSPGQKVLPAGPTPAGELGMGARPMSPGPGSPSADTASGPASGAGGGKRAAVSAATGPAGVAAAAAAGAARSAKSAVQRGAQPVQRAASSASEQAERSGGRRPSGRVDRPSSSSPKAPRHQSPHSPNTSGSDQP